MNKNKIYEQVYEQGGIRFTTFWEVAYDEPFPDHLGLGYYTIDNVPKRTAVYIDRRTGYVIANNLKHTPGIDQVADTEYGEADFDVLAYVKPRHADYRYFIPENIDVSIEEASSVFAHHQQRGDFKNMGIAFTGKRLWRAGKRLLVMGLYTVQNYNRLESFGSDWWYEAVTATIAFNEQRIVSTTLVVESDITDEDRREIVNEAINETLTRYKMLRSQLPEINYEHKT